MKYSRKDAFLISLLFSGVLSDLKAKVPVHYQGVNEVCILTNNAWFFLYYPTYLCMGTRVPRFWVK
jgi:hypothetical protein